MDKKKIIAVQIERCKPIATTGLGPDAFITHPAYQALDTGNFKSFSDWFKKKINEAREIASDKIKPKTKDKTNTVPSNGKEESHDSSVDAPPLEELIKKLTELDELFQIMHQYLVKNGYITETPEQKTDVKYG